MRTINVDEGQSLVDIAVQEFGTADGLSIICDLNDLEFDQDLTPGQTLLLPNRDENNDVQQYFLIKKIKVNSHLPRIDIDLLADNDGNVISNGEGSGLVI